MLSHHLICISKWEWKEELSWVACGDLEKPPVKETSKSCFQWSFTGIPVKAGDIKPELLMFTTSKVNLVADTSGQGSWRRGPFEIFRVIQGGSRGSCRLLIEHKGSCLSCDRGVWRSHGEGLLVSTTSTLGGDHLNVKASKDGTMMTINSHFTGSSRWGSHYKVAKPQQSMRSVPECWMLLVFTGCQGWNIFFLHSTELFKGMGMGQFLQWFYLGSHFLDLFLYFQSSAFSKLL